MVGHPFPVPAPLGRLPSFRAYSNFEIVTHTFAVRRPDDDNKQSTVERAVRRRGACDGRNGLKSRYEEFSLRTATVYVVSQEPNAFCSFLFLFLFSFTDRSTFLARSFRAEHATVYDLRNFRMIDFYVVTIVRLGSGTFFPKHRTS